MSASCNDTLLEGSVTRRQLRPRSTVTSARDNSQALFVTDVDDEQSPMSPDVFSKQDSYAQEQSAQCQESSEYDNGNESDVESRSKKPRVSSSKGKGKSRVQRKQPSKKSKSSRSTLEDVCGDEDFAIFEETGVGLPDIDEELDILERQAIHIPPRFRLAGDSRLGPKRSIQLDEQEQEQRRENFCRTARKIVRFLKETASNYVNKTEYAVSSVWRPMVPGMLALLRSGSEEFLLEYLLSGIDNDVQNALGKSKFTIQDLLDLPRWSDAKNIEKGVYLDVLYANRDGEQIELLYIGSGAGKFGNAQRWYDYLSKKCKTDSNKHSKEAADDSSEINLRGIAHYGNNPFPWLPCLAETFFMLYLGTIVDSGSRYERPDYRALLLHDELYRYVADCRSQAELEPPLALGLNSAWSLSQGYRQGLGPNAKCGNPECARPVLPKSHPDWKPRAFSSVDPSRPGEDVRCQTCRLYRGQNNNKERPVRLELLHNFRRTTPVPTKCSNPSCDRKLLSKQAVKELKARGEELPKDAGPARTFQDNRVEDGKCFWVCVNCQINKMGHVYELDHKPARERKRKSKT